VLQLTTRGNYGILAVCYIAQKSRNEYISIDEIVENSQIPKPYLSKILQDLCRGGVLLSRRGSGGGFTLANAPQDMSLQKVIEVIEGKVYLVNCLVTSSTLCGSMTNCPIAPMWGEVQKFILEIIASITIDDIIDAPKKQKMLTLLETCREMYRRGVQELKAETDRAG